MKKSGDLTGAIFLDRDGTINERAPDHQYITRFMDFRFLPGALEALAFLKKNSGRKIVIVTNQACVGLGLIPADMLTWNIHYVMRRAIGRAGGHVDAIYVCPHLDSDGCSCRKPKPGLFFTAAYEYDIDLGQSVMIGDSASDIHAAHAAGIPERILVRTGGPLPPYPQVGYNIVADIAAAARLAVKR